MIIGIPKEIKVRENRVGIVPGGVKVLVKNGHKVLIERGAGLGALITDELYKASGAELVETKEDIWQRSEMIIKVKEPVKPEYELMRPGQILYTYLHLAADKELTEVLMRRRVSAVAYETIQEKDGSLPLLKPMSEVAGRMSIQVGAQCLEKHSGGKGLLLGGVPGVRRSQVVIIGGGVVGTNAAKMAVGLGAQVTILDVDQNRLAYLDDIFGNKISTLMSNPENLAYAVKTADLVIGAVLVMGAKAPMLVTREMVKSMERGSAIVDVAIDQGGSVETIRPTTHENPTYMEEGVNHYGVTNIPGDVPQTSTYALTNATLPYALRLANGGLRYATESYKPLLQGLNCYNGDLVLEAVARAHDLPWKPAKVA
jgi:alanine dehydrogenase